MPIFEWDQEVLVELRSDQQNIQLIITDEGPGVPDELLVQLFRPFFRVADARDRSSGGTGLGLAIARQAIQLHQGEILAQNQINSGLKVTITLPKNV